MGHILIVEDEEIIRSSLKKLLEVHDYSVATAESADIAIEEHNLEDFDLVITDLRLPGEPGTSLIGKTSTPVLIMTSYASLQSAVQAMKLGAVDYVAKPFDHDEMLLSVERIMKERTLARQNKALKKELQQKYPTTQIIGSCAPMQELFRRISKVSPTDTTVLILGESGTGKELVARALHEQSHRAEGPMISVNCAAIPETLIEAELFGHEKGAFTGANALRKGLVEAADGGTLFLDEIGELPLEAQARLLRLLQEKEVRRVGAVESRKVNVRLCAATHRNLKELAEQGLFREDLYYRLHVVELSLPPLRDRGDDIMELADKLLLSTIKRLNSPVLHFSEETRLAIQEYPWPGNVRELENAIERAVILAEDESLTPQCLAIEAPSKTSIPCKDSGTSNADDEPNLSLEDYFQRFVIENQDNMTETELAQKLGISRKSLWERRQRLGIKRLKG